MILQLLSVLPRKYLSHLTGKVVHLEKPIWFSKWLKHTLIKKFNINTAEAEFETDHYPSFGSFFARRLKEGERVMSEDEFILPCDGVISEKGDITEGHLTQCKDINYSLQKLLKNETYAKQFLEGYFITIYLAPFNYHRVHTPADATVTDNYTIEGDLWPVNQKSVSSIDELFCINERNISVCETQAGSYAQIMVGATNVGAMELMPDIQKGNTIKKGGEYGIFNMGSTVVLLFDSNLKESLKIDHTESGPVRCLESFNRK